MLFLEQLQRNCEQLGDKVALEFVPENDENQYLATYEQLEAGIRRTMQLLQLAGVTAGDRVALQLPKSLAFIYLHLATMRLGAISLPLNPGYPARELRYFLDDAGAKVLFAEARNSEMIDELRADLSQLSHVVYLEAQTDRHFRRLLPKEPLNAPLPDDPDRIALMIYTSGTTGRPKGATLTHGNISANLNSLHEAWEWQQDDIILHVLPIFHVHGLIVALHGALHAGATAVLLSKFDAEHVLDLLGSGWFSVFMGVPTIHRRLYEAAAGEKLDLSRMRLITSGSDRLPDDLFEGYQETFGYTLLERYGMSETGMLISNPFRGDRRVGSVGKPLPGVEVRIVDPESEEPLADGEVGAVQVRGANVCPGYWQKPEKTREAFTEDGWLRTGDLGTRSEDGYFTLKGRAKDLIISGGYNIYPPEVELVLADHPAVGASAVIGCPDDEWGERVVACIVPKANAVGDAEEIIAYCRERLVNYKAPRRVVFLDQLPRNALGKVQKSKLREQVCR